MVTAGQRSSPSPIPHPLNPDLFHPGKDYDKPSIDVGMRSYRYPPYLGDNDRNRIIDYFVEHGPELGLRLDISKTKRFIPADWAGFLGDCKVVLSTETGSWYLRSDDALVKQFYAFAWQQRSGIDIGEDNPLRRLVRYLPASVKSPLMSILKNGPFKYDIFEYEKLDFDEVYQHFLKTARKCPAHSKAISSRNFVAIGIKTCQIMFPGRFNNILKPGEHYISLNPDFSNLVDVLEKLRDKEIWSNIVEQAYQLVMDSHTYPHRARPTCDIVHIFVKAWWLVSWGAMNVDAYGRKRQKSLGRPPRQVDRFLKV